jgi:hypothetical protein
VLREGGVGGPHNKSILPSFLAPKVLDPDSFDLCRREGPTRVSGLHHHMRVQINPMLAKLQIKPIHHKYTYDRAFTLHFIFISSFTTSISLSRIYPTSQTQHSCARYSAVPINEIQKEDDPFTLATVQLRCLETMLGQAKHSTPSSKSASPLGEGKLIIAPS